MDTHEFIVRSKTIHGDKYDYSKVVYKNNLTKVCIICPEHGEFEQTPKRHLRRQGCPECGKLKKGVRVTTEEFIEKATQVHGDKYDYSQVQYIDSETKVKIICPIHGEFWQTPHNHLQGQGCIKCGGKLCFSKEDFISLAETKHGNKYDYSQVEYVNTSTKVCIICPEHGEFWQTPNDHLNGKGCPECGKESSIKKRTLTKEEFIERSCKIHNNKFSYENVVYTNMMTPVYITCPEHGVFLQKPVVHIQGYGCPKCSGKHHYTTEEYVERANEVHNNRYDYSETEYIDAETKVTVICPEHGKFTQLAYDHLQGKGCPKCAKHTSNGEEEIIEHIKECGIDVCERERTILNGREIDIYLPSIKVGIEYDGMIWHSEKFGKGDKYHLLKTEECEKQGIRLIHIFENEYVSNKALVLNKIDHIIGVRKEKTRIYARKCSVKEINKTEAEGFMIKYHIQGFKSSTIYLGCFYNESMIGVMSFLKMNKNTNYWELTRFATDYHYLCCGVGGKLFSYFIKKYNPEEVKSFADRRWTSVINTTLYTRLGFQMDKILPPDYYYTSNKGDLIHKFNFRKQRMNKKYGYDLSLTESEMAHMAGYYKIYNCGLVRYVWSKS